MSSVTVPRSVLVALVATLVLCLGLAAFLAGRASAPAAPPAGGPTVTTATIGAPAGAALPASGPAPAAPIPYVPPPDAAPAGAVAPAGVVASLAPAAPAEAARVARYFQEMETAQASAKYWSDPQALAGSLVDGLSKGDRSGFDQLIGATQGALERMKALEVPPDCAEHHRRSVDLVQQGVALLGSIAEGAAKGDVSAFSSLPTVARQLEADAKDVDTLAERIKQRYGVS